MMLPTTKIDFVSNTSPFAPNIDRSPFTRALEPRDFEDLRLIRLEALWFENGYFADSYDDENKLTDEEWLDWCQDKPEKCIVGLFDEEKLIGITAIIKWAEAPAERTALFGRSYITRKYRGNGLASLLYGARLDWAKRHKQYDFAVVYHREGNFISKKMNERYGAKYWRTVPKLWPDGQVANAIWYRIDLKSNILLPP